MTKQLIPFSISRLDSLGQGVSFQNAQVCFIPKTLPGETGEAKVYKRNKKAQFATTINFTELSKKRIEPDCPHFNECNGCSYLHTSYEYELELKFKAAAHYFKKWISPEKIILHPAKQRFNYRNRVQLHYDKKQKKLGFIDPIAGGIHPIPHCKLPLGPIRERLLALYHDNAWLEETISGPNKGHLEVGQQGDCVYVSVNQPYAAAGFTQVNQEMNLYLKNFLKEKIDAWHDNKTKQLLDLFGGKGNLTELLTQHQVSVIDRYGETTPSTATHQTAHHLDLYAKNALSLLTKLCPITPEVLLLDPPRSGLLELPQFIDALSPKKIIYLSCFFPTLARDITTILERKNLQELHFFDFFPGTHHLETMAIIG